MVSEFSSSPSERLDLALVDTIRDKTFGLCKSGRQNSSSPELRKIISSLNVIPSDTDVGEDRSHLGYLARNLGAQFLGYLVVDKKRDVLAGAGVAEPRI